MKWYFQAVLLIILACTCKSLEYTKITSKVIPPILFCWPITQDACWGYSSCKGWIFQTMTHNCFLPCYKEKSGKRASDISAYKQKSITEFCHVEKKILYLMNMSTNNGCASVVATVMQQAMFQVALHSQPTNWRATQNSIANSDYVEKITLCNWKYSWSNGIIVFSILVCMEINKNSLCLICNTRKLITK